MNRMFNLKLKNNCFPVDIRLKSRMNKRNFAYLLLIFVLQAGVINAPLMLTILDPHDPHDPERELVYVPKTQSQLDGIEPKSVQSKAKPNESKWSWRGMCPERQQTYISIFLGRNAPEFFVPASGGGAEIPFPAARELVKELGLSVNDSTLLKELRIKVDNHLPSTDPLQQEEVDKVIWKFYKAKYIEALEARKALEKVPSVMPGGDSQLHGPIHFPSSSGAVFEEYTEKAEVAEEAKQLSKGQLKRRRKARKKAEAEAAASTASQAISLPTPLAAPVNSASTLGSDIDDKKTSKTPDQSPTSVHGFGGSRLDIMAERQEDVGLDGNPEKTHKDDTSTDSGSDNPVSTGSPVNEAEMLEALRDRLETKAIRKHAKRKEGYIDYSNPTPNYPDIGSAEILYELINRGHLKSNSTDKEIRGLSNKVIFDAIDLIYEQKQAQKELDNKKSVIQAELASKSPEEKVEWALEEAPVGLGSVIFGINLIELVGHDRARQLEELNSHLARHNLTRERIVEAFKERTTIYPEPEVDESFGTWLIATISYVLTELLHERSNPRASGAHETSSSSSSGLGSADTPPAHIYQRAPMAQQSVTAPGSQSTG